MKSLLILSLALSFFSNSFAQNAVRVEKGNRPGEIKEINSLFSDINYNGGCTALGRVSFYDKKEIPQYCGGTFSKKQSGDNKYLVLENTRCSNVVVGLETSTNWFFGSNLYIQEYNTATRMYKLENPKDNKITIQINKDALGYDNDTYVVLASNSGKSCFYMDIRF